MVKARLDDEASAGYITEDLSERKVRAEDDGLHLSITNFSPPAGDVIERHLGVRVRVCARPVDQGDRSVGRSHINEALSPPSAVSGYKVEISSRLLHNFRPSGPLSAWED